MSSPFDSGPIRQAQGLRRDCRVGRNNKSISAFTLLELIACISIIAVIAGAIAMPALVDMFTKSRQIADQRTLLTLNDALNRFKCEGGGTAGLTVGAPISHVLAAMQGDINWNGFHHNVMQAGQTFHGKSIDALGVGSQYHFTRFGTYTAEAGGTSPSDLGASGGSLVGWWKMDETSGSTAADSSGKGNNGSLTGSASFVAGQYGNALNVDGSNVCGISVPHSTSLDMHPSNAFTLSLWLKLNAFPATFLPMIWKNDAPSFWVNSTGAIMVRPDLGAGVPSYTLSGGVPSTNTWYHLVATYDGSTITIYRNGALKGSQAAVGTFVGNTQPFRIGCASSGATISGLIDDVRVFNRALTAAEVLQLYNSQ